MLFEILMRKRLMLVAFCASLAACSSAETPPAETVELPPLPFAANGSEPGWALRMEADETRLDWQYGEQQLSAPTPAPETQNGALLYRLESGDARAVAQISGALCRDAATGQPHPWTVQLTVDEQAFSGCGGDPAQLLHGPAWRVEDLARRGVIDASHMTLQFEPDGTLHGSAGCNQYHGAYSVTGEGLATGAFAATRKACAPALMSQEARFLEMIQAVVRFDFSETDALQLFTADGQPITARRMAAPEG